MRVVDYFPTTFSMDMILRAFWRSGNFRNTRRWNRGRVLLTGSTGFLGSYLLRDLIKHTKVNCACLQGKHVGTHVLKVTGKCMIDASKNGGKQVLRIT